MPKGLCTVPLSARGYREVKAVSSPYPMRLRGVLPRRIMAKAKSKAQEVVRMWNTYSESLLWCS